MKLKKKIMFAIYVMQQEYGNDLECYLLCDNLVNIIL